MSSEAEARRQVLAEMGRGVVDGVDHQTLISGVSRAVAVLDAYKEQIERRVLAQQPCYGVWGFGGAMAVGQRCNGTTCPSCKARTDEFARTARQTQETSG